MTAHLTVTDAHAAVVTDLGRTRGPMFALAAGGALDQHSARVANILVANPENTPLIEITVFDFAFVTDEDVLIAATGADMTLHVDGVTRSMWQPVPVAAGQRVSLTAMAAGVRCYIAIHGGLDVPRLLGSCAPDTVVGFGTRLAPAGVDPAASGTVPLGSRSPIIGDLVNPYYGVPLFHLDAPRPVHGETTVVDVTDGPDIGQFAGTADRLFTETYRVTPHSNHIGLRMTGALPVRHGRGEMISRGVPVGAIEVPPGDELLVLHRGRGVTAGYPVLGVVTSGSLDALGQIRPGQAVAFRRVDIDRAAGLARSRRAALDTLRKRVTTVFSCLAADDLAPPRPERSLT